MTKIIYNKLLGGYFICKGPHHTPISGRFDTKAAAQGALAAAKAKRDAPRGPRHSDNYEAMIKGRRRPWTND
jgi:hypothetical protein